MRKNEHPGCHCKACRRGSRSDAGHFTIRYTNRVLRRRYRAALRTYPFDVTQIVVSTPYTD
jgi:hypothetical protein